jgi:hypothetical protein
MDKFFTRRLQETNPLGSASNNNSAENGFLPKPEKAPILKEENQNTDIHNSFYNSFNKFMSGTVNSNPFHHRQQNTHASHHSIGHHQDSSASDLNSSRNQCATTTNSTSMNSPCNQNGYNISTWKTDNVLDDSRINVKNCSSRSDQYSRRANSTHQNREDEQETRDNFNQPGGSDDPGSSDPNGHGNSSRDNDEQKLIEKALKIARELISKQTEASNIIPTLHRTAISEFKSMLSENLQIMVRAKQILEKRCRRFTMNHNVQVNTREGI